MTLWPLENVVCFSAPYTRSFVAPRCSTAYCLHCLCVVALVTLPLLAAFASDNVWVKESFYREQPSVAFQHDLLVVLGGSSPADAVGWGTRSNLDALLPSEVRVPVVRSGTSDVNLDGVPDTLTLSVDMPTGNASKGFRSVTLLACYNVELRGKVLERLSGLVAVSTTSSYAATGLWVRGRLQLRQSLPLHVTDQVREVYAASPLLVEPTSSWAASQGPMTLRALLDRYSARNETVHLEQVVPAVWDHSPRDSFSLQLVIDVPPQLVHYVPGAAEVLKFAWMQVHSFLVPLWVVLQGVKAFAFDHQIVETYVVPQLPGTGG